MLSVVLIVLPLAGHYTENAAYRALVDMAILMPVLVASSCAAQPHKRYISNHEGDCGATFFQAPVSCPISSASAGTGSSAYRTRETRNE